MGRPRVILTPQQVLERQQRYWGEERNKGRRVRYAEDREYRQKVIGQVKKTYRKVREDKGLFVRVGDCRSSLVNLRVIGTVRRIVESPYLIANSKALLFSIDELAFVFGRHPQVIGRWVLQEMFPKPPHVAEDKSGKIVKVYSEPEVRGLVAIMGEHQERSQYYRKHHTEVRGKLLAIVKEIEDKRKLT